MDNVKLGRRCRACGKDMPKQRNKFCSDACSFQSKVKIEESTGCVLWVASVARDGYGSFYARGKLIPAHRAAFRMAYGEFNESLNVPHRCDNPRCVNPDHLFLGTQAQNVADMLRKQRHVPSRGVANGRSKLTDEIVRDMFVLRSKGQSFESIGRIYGVSRVTVSSIVKRLAWRHVAIGETTRRAA